MKNINTSLLIFVAFFFWLMGDLTSDFGKPQPAYVVDWELCITGILMLITLFVLGWMSAAHYIKHDKK